MAENPQLEAPSCKHMRMCVQVGTSLTVRIRLSLGALSVDMVPIRTVKNEQTEWL